MIDTHYSHANRLTQITTASGSTDYRYNAFGQRTHKITDSGTTYYLYDEAGLLLSEYNAQGDILKEYIWLNGEPLAQVVDGFVYYYHNDRLGTPQAMTDQDQNVVWQGHYTPFGDVAIVTDVVENNLRFPGQYYDQETGLHYNWHRYYDPAIGRYLQSDPIGILRDYNDPQLQVAIQNGILERTGFMDVGLNHLYDYVDSNPMIYVDPFGLHKNDNWYGLPKKFWKWAHKQKGFSGLKGPNGQISIDDAKDLYEEWKQKGKPGPKVPFFVPLIIWEIIQDQCANGGPMANNPFACPQPPPPQC